MFKACIYVCIHFKYFKHIYLYIYVPNLSIWVVNIEKKPTVPGIFLWHLNSAPQFFLLYNFPEGKKKQAHYIIRKSLL